MIPILRICQPLDPAHQWNGVYIYVGLTHKLKDAHVAHTLEFLFGHIVFPYPTNPYEVSRISRETPAFEGSLPLTHRVKKTSRITLTLMHILPSRSSQ